MEKILIVDDNRTICHILSDMMNVLGYDNSATTEGKQALNLLREEIFSVVIADIEMPGMDGLTLIRRIKEVFSEIDVISITGYGTKYSYSEVIKNGASDFITKPFGIDEISAKLNRIFRERRIKKELKEKNVVLLKLSINDDLTGLYNRRHFYNQLEKEIIRAQRQNRPLFLLILDLDGFKKYNDTFGHIGGDKLLKEVGKAVLSSIRKNVDEAFRYGGDEFTIIIPEATQEQALKIAQRIQEACAHINPHPINISIGLSELQVGQGVESLVHCADQAMYQAKHSLDKIVMFGEKLKEKDSLTSA